MIGKLAVVAAVAAAAWYYLAFVSVDMAGGTPAMHVGIPYGFTLADMPDLKGKTFVVTGANVGLGLSTSKHLAAGDARVIMACRNADKCAKAAEEVKKHSKGKGEAVPMVLNLSSLQSARDFAKAVKADKAVVASGLDSLILNAGFMPKELRMTADNLEESFQVNHLGHFAIFELLVDDLLRAKAPTVVAVSSNLHTMGRYYHSAAGVPLSVEELNDDTAFESVSHYGMGKLCNILFIKELDRRYHDKGIVATAAHPGGVDTNFLDRIFEDNEEGKAGMQSMLEPVFRLFHVVFAYLAWQPDEAALSLVGAAVKPIGHGEYTVPIHRPLTPTKQARDMAVAAKLWDFSHDLVAASSK